MFGLLGHLRPILVVALGYDDACDARPHGGESFFFDATNRKHEATQGEFTRHRDVGQHRAGQEQRRKAQNMATPALGPSLGTAPAGTCTWTSHCASSCGSSPELSGARAQQTKRRGRRLFHYVANLTGDGDFSAPRHAGGFDKENFAAGWSICQSGRDARDAGPRGDLGIEARRPEIVRYLVGPCDHD